MGMIGDSLDRALHGTFTQPIPKSGPAQMRYLVKQLKGTKRVADALAISQRTVERYVRNQIKRPRAELAARLESEVKKRWQPQVRARAKRAATTTGGIVIDTRARFGFTAAPGSTDDARLRLITQALPPTYAARLFDAHDAGANEAQLQAIAAEGLQEIYFKDRGRRAAGLAVEFTDIDYLDFEL
ncbi:XRE family transcriptional regulator (plasmid) [Actinacidiphila glaucinigra]|uniref:telomere-protecting terminal protein Tpg n=1 Tax=Actinacidiphila glaucinigra TaxID=235986 RepID=UPI002DD9D061|nr:XRE family transcriptional regulator [Actinacidiphila glaucinigra]WSD65798.1 XRE family transcriptional regulator [Actinacidiphila glaucinigra]